MFPPVVLSLPPFGMVMVTVVLLTGSSDELPLPDA